MAEYIFRGSITLQGVDFFITADTPGDAVNKAKAGDYHHYEADRAETVNLAIDPLTGERN